MHVCVYMHIQKCTDVWYKVWPPGYTLVIEDIRSWLEQNYQYQKGVLGGTTICRFRQMYREV